jgi:hypothetical protein
MEDPGMVSSAAGGTGAAFESFISDRAHGLLTTNA